MRSLLLAARLQQGGFDLRRRREHLNVRHYLVQRGLDEHGRVVRRAEHRVEDVPAVRMDTGAFVRACNHAENDARSVPAAHVVRIGVRALRPHAVKRQAAVRREYGERAVKTVDIVRAGEHLRADLSEKRQGSSRVALRERSPFELSGGQKRRVAIAGVIAMRPEVLILDEPTAGLDPKAHKDVLAMVEEVHRRTGNITILVSHNMADIARLSDKVLVIDNGRLVLDGTPFEVFSQHETLKKVGLALPPVTQFTEELREKGIGLTDTILTVDEAVNQIYEYLTERRREAADAGNKEREYKGHTL